MSLSAAPRRASGPVRLPLGRRVAVYAVAGGVWATGAAWLLWRWFLRTPGDFGPQPSPLEPWWLKAHGLFAFAALWIGGLLWAAHVVGGWSSGRRRGSGGVLFAALVVLIASGYLLYYAGDDRLRGAVSTLHWVVGLAAAGPFAWHRLRSRR